MCLFSICFFFMRYSFEIVSRKNLWNVVYQFVQITLGGVKNCLQGILKVSKKNFKSQTEINMYNNKRYTINYANKIRTRSSCSFSKLNSSIYAFSRYRRITTISQLLYANIFQIIRRILLQYDKHVMSRF